MNDKALSRQDLLFVLGCAAIYAIAVLVVPSYTPLIDADSGAYTDFSAFRPAYYPAFLALCRALGLGLVATTWVQLGLFCVALCYLLVALLRSRVPKIWLALLVAMMAGNILFSSFHRSILSESLYFSLSIVAVALWIDYFRTARPAYIVGAGLSLGLMLGIRLAGLGLLPLHLLAVWVKRPKGVPFWMALLLALLPPLAGIAGERMLYYAVHGSGSISQAQYLLFAKAAMLIRPEMTFTGPHAAALDDIGRQLAQVYGPVQAAAAQAPSLPVRVQLSAIYEGLAQYSVLGTEIDQAAARAGISPAILRTELAKQVIAQNPGGYLTLTLLNEIGQWSVAAQNFPSIARALNAYADTDPAVSVGGRIPATLLHPKPSLTGVIVYPAFLAAGAVTLVLALGFFVFLARPALADNAAGFYLLIATYLSAMCHGYTLFISLVNEWTPRFLMAIFPHLEIIGICLVLSFLHWRGYMRWTAPARLAS
ncbi:hypothetical protein DW352_00165 [Pseudolabrys taiwanensis]|uniref:Uncharacterized protein n=1 Tax=Pseudolabrys taiwanensis TaxID=331696 RepID=A0A345ZQ75_9HYPH|nr:hypothetical protein [Pseudolabrys taiwanensis]AXK79072.1 hypothetical protein DW352_00165 [Pseudolabrys taiwanensis]